MSVIVFCGPSIKKEQVLNILPNADVRSPAQQGDVYLATCDNPKVILLIDGFFESVPAVWHKEILYAMSIGIHVYGSSSMGALRAAELSMFGMEGSGQIFEQYNSGELEDDDEVALVHGPKEVNFMPISRAMIDLRSDLNRAVDKGLFTEEQANTIADQLKAIWYPERSHQTLSQLAQDFLSDSQRETLNTFLKTECPSLKETDALQLITQISELDLTTLPEKTVDYAVCKNDAWHTLINDVVKSRKINIDIDLPVQQQKETPASAINELGVNNTDSTKLQDTVTSIFPAKLRARALEHAQELGLDPKPWVRPAFHKVATAWKCVDENGNVQFEEISKTIHSLAMNTKQFDAWIEREALLLAYADQVDIQTEHILDEQLIRQETN